MPLDLLPPSFHVGVGSTPQRAFWERFRRFAIVCPTSACVADEAAPFPGAHARVASNAPFALLLCLHAVVRFPDETLC